VEKNKIKNKKIKKEEKQKTKKKRIKGLFNLFFFILWEVFQLGLEF